MSERAASNENQSRLPRPYGRWIDRNKAISFRFDGHAFTGFEGDTLSTALWANGVRVLGRSFKYHRARGISSLSGIDTNCMVEDDHSTNLRGDLLPLREGLDVRAVNTLGGAQNDVLRILGRFHAFTPVGFYYKAFHTPKSLFPFYERFLRRLGGLGRVNTTEPIKHTPKRYDFCDVLVAGAGPAGLSAAVAAAKQGAKVLLIDENPALGGSLNYHAVADSNAETILKDLLAQVTASPSIVARTSTIAVSHDADNWVALLDAEALTKVRARTVVYANGCYEQPAVFRNNDLPGVMLMTAARRLVHLYAVAPFKNAVVLAANAEAYEGALDLHRAGLEVQAIVDLRPAGEKSEVGRAADEAGIHIHRGACIYEAIPSAGARGVSAVTICRLDDQGRPRPETAEREACDGIAMSVQFTPADGLLRQAGTVMRYEPALEQFVPDKCPSFVFAAGKVNGVFDLAARVADGAAAGEEAVAALNSMATQKTARPVRQNGAHSHPYPIFPHPKGGECVDLDEDLQVKDIETAFAEGFDSVELLKRYSTFGMGPSQGKHSNLNALRILSRLRGENMTGQRGPTARPYVRPVPLSHLAGRIFTPRYGTNLNAWHEQQGAEFTYVGAWLRPKFYRVQGRAEDICTAAEAIAVRRSVGIIDVGTLGKLEVFGPDAAKFLECTYTGEYARMKPGTTRYGVMCDEAGTIINDGVIARLAEDRFYVTATTTGVEAVFREMRRNALVWKHDVFITDATHQYGAVSLAGPKSRELLAAVTGIAVTDADFPHLASRQAEIAGVPARIFRLGFVSKVGYEIHVPADGAQVVWNALMREGAPYDIRPCGVEAQRILRLEMGHFIVGQDTDALTNPYELGLEWALKMQKAFFIGQRSLRALKNKPIERKLAAFILDKKDEECVPAGNHLVILNGDIAGRVTSIHRSPILNRFIGLAYVRPEQAQPGAEINIRSRGGKIVSATIALTPFFHEDSAGPESGATAAHTAPAERTQK